eukprot:sb/3466526/
MFKKSCKTYILAMDKRPVYGSTKHYIMVDWKGKSTEISDGITTTKLPIFTSQVYYTTKSLLCNPGDDGDAVCLAMDSLNTIRKVPGRVIGLEHATGRYLLKQRDHGVFSYYGDTARYPNSTISRYHPGKNSSEPYPDPCIASIQDLPIAWVTVVNNQDVVVATKNSRILFVSEGLITSNIRVENPVHYISVLSDILIRVHHGNSVTDLTIPVLSHHTTNQGPASAANQGPAFNGCLSSCQKIKMQQLELLAEERARCEDKRRFVEEMWRGLFKLTPQQRVDERPFVRQFTGDEIFHVENNAAFQKQLRDSLDLQMRQSPDELSTDCLAHLLRLSQS